MSESLHDLGYRKWIHRLAMLLAVVVFPLIWVGGLVTTYDAGMAVPDWPSTYGWNMFAYPLSTWLSGPFDLLVEHGHRLLGSAAGLIAIALLVVAFRQETRLWFIVWTFCLLLAVVAQGMLGGARVLLDDRTLAMIHGCFGPAFFAMTAATAAMSSPWWFDVRAPSDTRGRGSHFTLAMFGSILLVVAYGQLVLGAQLRHLSGWETHRQFTAMVHAHLGTAALLVLLNIGTVAMALLIPVGRRVKSPFLVLAALVLVQLLLGVGTWIVNYALPWSELNKTLAAYTIQAKGFTESLIVTGHVATGSLIVAVAAVAAVRAWRFRWVVRRGSVK